MGLRGQGFEQIVDLMTMVNGLAESSTTAKNCLASFYEVASANVMSILHNHKFWPYQGVHQYVLSSTSASPNPPIPEREPQDRSNKISRFTYSRIRYEAYRRDNLPVTKEETCSGIDCLTD